MLTPQFLLDIAPGLVVDLFAGGGGASAGIEQAIGRHVDVAINHDEEAIGMHEANHPQTHHYRADIWGVGPITVTRGRHVGLLHASPDCTDHSQAKGGQPRRQEIRSLAWVVHRWAGRVKPDVITLENVEQMLRWSSLVAKRDRATGRVVTLETITDPVTHRRNFRVAEPGERVERRNQFLIADERHLGTQWRRFVSGLRRLGYAVEWRVICNADLGAHSTRTRLYMVARRDGLPIVWPKRTHAKVASGRLKAHRAAAECIDWSIPGKSIFGRAKPLADATLKRIAYGLERFVLNSPEPFIVNNTTGSAPRPVSDPIGPVLTGGHKMLLAPTLMPLTHQGAERGYDLRGPLPTITAAHRGEQAIAAATLVQMGHGQGAGRTRRRSNGANDIRGAIGTVTASGSGGYGVAAAYMVQANGGWNATPARSLRRPMSVVTASGSQQQLIAANLVTLRHNANGRRAREPLGTIATANQQERTLADYALSPEHKAGALRCAAFLMRYHGSGGQWADPRHAMTTITTRARLALVTVWIQGEPWVVVDICLRMLTPRELYRAQDFPENYVIDRTADGHILTKTAQIRMCGNSVSPLPMRLLVAANYRDVATVKARRAA